METDAQRSRTAARRYLKALASLFFVGGIAFYFGGPILLAKGKIASCNANHYSGDVYLAYCASQSYGDVEHGLLYFDMDRTAQGAIARADLVVFGNSITQFAFSTDNVRQTLNAKAVPYYLLGFAYFETIDFARMLATRLAMRPRVVVIDADAYFWSTKVSAPVQTLLAGSPGTRLSYVEKLAWQSLHALICGSEFGRKLKFCGDALSIFRARSDGAWVGLADWKLPSRPLQRSTEVTPVRGEENRSRAAKAAALAESLNISRHCLIVTNVPNDKTAPEEGQLLAGMLGATYIAPAIDGTQTIDGIHLDTQSAERWSGEFLERLFSQVNDCFVSVR